jgi:hypothetical protein
MQVACDRANRSEPVLLLDCNIEFTPTKDGFKIFRIEEDGTSVPEASLLDSMVTEAATNLKEPVAR